MFVGPPFLPDGPHCAVSAGPELAFLYLGSQVRAVPKSVQYPSMCSTGSHSAAPAFIPKKITFG